MRATGRVGGADREEESEPLSGSTPAHVRKGAHHVPLRVDTQHPEALLLLERGVALTRHSGPRMKPRALGAQPEERPGLAPCPLRSPPVQPWPTSTPGTGRPEQTGSRRQELNSGNLYLLQLCTVVSHLPKPTPDTRMTVCCGPGAGSGATAWQVRRAKRSDLARVSGRATGTWGRGRRSGGGGGTADTSPRLALLRLRVRDGHYPSSCTVLGWLRRLPQGPG